MTDKMDKPREFWVLEFNFTNSFGNISQETLYAESLEALSKIQENVSLNKNTNAFRTFKVREVKE
jgi:hypothetical protein